jgi:hypothetical protein
MRRRSLTGLRKPKALRPWWFNGMLTEVRQRVIRLGQGGRGRKTDPAWAARPRLLRGTSGCSPIPYARMWNSLIDTGDDGPKILGAYVVR